MEQNERLAALERDVKAMEREFAQYRADSIVLLTDIRERIGKCVTLERYKTVESIALGLAALALVAVISAVLSRVIH